MLPKAILKMEEIDKYNKELHKEPWAFHEDSLLFEMPKPNIELKAGILSFNFRVEDTRLIRLKYWLFSKFFPFEVIWG